MVAEQPYGKTISINGNPFIMAGQDKNAAARARAEAFQSDVWDVLKKIEDSRGSRVGRILMRAMNAAQPAAAVLRTVTIIPFTFGVVDARTAPTNEDRATILGDKFKDVDFKTNQSIHVGRGGGSSVVIRFEPRTFLAPCAARVTLDPSCHYEVNFVLFHELVHALRQMRGLLAHNASVNVFEHRVPIEEFYAFFLTNIYMSESGVPDEELRAFPDPNIAGRYVPFKEASNSYAFIARSFCAGDLQQPIDALRTAMPDVAGAIGTLAGISWNPLAVH